MTVARDDAGPPYPATLAADLHDGLSQHLFAAAMDLDEVRALPGLPAGAEEILARLAERLGSSANELRTTLVAMLAAEPAARAADPASLREAVAAAVADFAADHPIEVDLRIGGDGPEPDLISARLLIRAVREGLANVAKHAAASRAAVVLHRGMRMWAVDVCDDGTGQPDAIAALLSPPTTFGLASLAHEAARLGGHLGIYVAPALGGIQLRVSVPTGRPGRRAAPASA